MSVIQEPEVRNHDAGEEPDSADREAAAEAWQQWGAELSLLTPDGQPPPKAPMLARHLNMREIGRYLSAKQARVAADYRKQSQAGLWAAWSHALRQQAVRAFAAKH